MYKSGFLFGFLTLIGVLGAGALLGNQVLAGEIVAAKPLVNTALQALPTPQVERAIMPQTDPREIYEVQPAPPVQIADAVEVPTITALSALVVDAESGAVLYEREPDEGRGLASLTKLATALTASSLEPMWAMTSTVDGYTEIVGRTFFTSGDIVTLRDLFFASLAGSSNRASFQLADAIMPEGASFVAKMRLVLDELGFDTVEVADAAGLRVENSGTAWDVIKMFRLALDQPLLREALGSVVYELNTKQGEGRQVSTSNLLLLGDIPAGSVTVLAGKTGYLPEVGFNFVMEVEDENEHRLDVVVLGAEDHFARFTEAKKLADWAFENYTWENQK